MRLPAGLTAVYGCIKIFLCLLKINTKKLLTAEKQRLKITNAVYFTY